jgi:hypothetical protein
VPIHEFALRGGTKSNIFLAFEVLGTFILPAERAAWFDVKSVAFILPCEVEAGRTGSDVGTVVDFEGN